MKKINTILESLHPKGCSGGGTALVARQPIFDLSGAVWGYELLFRDPGHKQGLEGKNSHCATSTVMVDGFELLRPSLRQGQRFLINFTHELLEAEVASILPSNICAIEILETITPTPEILQAVVNLKKNGYTIALDDFTGQEYLVPFISHTDIVKIDVLGKTEAELRELIRFLDPYGKLLLAEKVEDSQTAHLCRKLGFALFQGFFFSKVELILGKKLTPSQITKTRMLALSADDNTELQKFIEVISSDVFLTYRLLKYINSVHFGLPVKVNSISHAVALIGKERLLQWICVIALAEIDSTPMSREIAYISALRARFLEELAIRHLKQSKTHDIVPNNLFLLGLFSLLESILAIPLAEITQSIPMEESIVLALGSQSGPYYPWLRLIELYERGDWQEMEDLISKLGISHRDLIETYVDAMNWSAHLYSM